MKLTSIVHPKSEMGESAANTIIDLIESQNMDAFNVSLKIYEPELIIRSSTKEINYLETISYKMTSKF